MSAASLCLLAFLIHAPAAEAFPYHLRKGPRVQAAQPLMNRTDVETILMNEFSSVSHGGDVNAHISGLEVALKPMYTSVPKEADGTLSHSVVRYMLHRHFVQKHGWFIRGLEPGNTSSLQATAGENHSLQSLQEWVPSYLQKFIEELRGGRGINLRELAVMAATLEDLIHKESLERLEMTFTALELPISTQLNEDQMRQSLEVYMMIYVLGGNFTITGREGILMAHKVFAENFGKKNDNGKAWEAVQQWMHSVQAEVVPASVDPASADHSLNFTVASRVVEEVGRKYGAYTDAECGNLKAEILQIESTKAGRVRLADFYKKGLVGNYDFTEKAEYLRALGTLDESNASDPYLIVPNYVSARPNCVKVSNFYVVCCRNECEELLATVEKKFETPTANPEKILELVATFSTKTVEGPRTLSDTMVQRLKSIADANEGEVPLHGRLFAQWMHHAFPRECPYPQQSGMVAPMTADEWMQATGHKSARKSDEEMQLIVDSDSSFLPVGERAREHHHLPENELPWDEAEELLHHPKKAPPQRGWSEDDVVTLVASMTEAPKSRPRSLIDKAAPLGAIAAFILSVGVFALKMSESPEHKRSKSLAQLWQDDVMA